MSLMRKMLEHGSEREDSEYDSNLSKSSDDINSDWKDEVSEDGELFYVQGEAIENPLHEENAFDTTNITEHNLHGTSQEPDHQAAINAARRNARFQPIERAEFETYNLPPQTSWDGSRQRNLEETTIEQKQSRELKQFQLHSEQNGSNLKDVILSVNAASSYGRKGFPSLLESMLGIESKINLNDDQQSINTHSPNSLVVTDLISNGPTFVTQNVKLGDILLAVNGVAVYHSNIEQVLRRVPEKMILKLTFQCCRANCQLEMSFPQTDRHEKVLNNVGIPLAKLKPDQMIIPSEMEKVVTSSGSYQAVFFLTLNVSSETTQGEEDILYSYPPSDNPSTRKLKCVRGIFTTLADVSKDAFNSKVLSTTLSVDEELVHCAYCHHGSEVLVICVPASTLPVAHLHEVVDNTFRLLHVMFKSLTLAFQPENSSRLDHLFYLLFTSNIWLSAPYSEFQGLINPPVRGTRSLALSEDLYSEVDLALAELEAADFDDGLHSAGLTRRLYNILGSCFFYKGYLVANHLPDDDSKDIAIFCQYYCLLGKLRKGNLLIWREIYPCRRKNLSKKSKSFQEFEETDGKYFLMIVGLRYSLLSILMQAGGGAVAAIGKLGPDTTYVNRARATILHLESMEIPAHIDEQLSQPSIPTLSSADELTRKPLKSVFNSISHNKPPSGSGQSKPHIASSQGIMFPFASSSKKASKSVLESSMGATTVNISQNTMEKTASSPLRRIESKKSLASQGSEDSVGSASKGMKSLASGFSMGDLRNALPVRENYEMKRLTVGPHNTLFHFLHLDSESGILITPSDQDISCLDGPFHHNLISNFRQCVLLIRERLASAYSKNPSLKSYEEGTLFHCEIANILPEGNKKPTPFVQYWVVGRTILRPSPCQFYVCFHDSAQQNILELAFQMGFGR